MFVTVTREALLTLSSGRNTIANQKKIRYMDYVHYDMSGKIIESGNEPTSWGRAIPGSIGETALKAFCQKEKPTIIFPNTSPEKVAEAIRKYRTSNGEWK